MSFFVNKKLGVGLSVLAALAAVGCYKHSYTVGSGGNLNADPKYSNGFESHWFFGIIGESEVDIKQVCPSGNATIKDRISFLNGLIGAFIGIVWHPSTVEVYCGEGGAAAPAAAPAEEKPAEAAEPAEPATSKLQLTPEQMRRIAADPRTMEWAMKVSPLKAAELQAAMEAYQKSHQNVAKNPSSAAVF